ncbi:uncharacterized protein N7500_010390 [Penicillium coprophilum]|uniref:uncharacterized protein n=1 Tax=Penicillium coprophilum TaxID=36646 RepID=UPI0023A2CF87|nr:uncharacterized protein N7500_010390 [Penicillium coprophilum]KAJ5154951.1 hypothetical protein N7500_010390 [Penicillium coprophilum]
MRSFIIAPILIAGALAQSTSDYLSCASAAINTLAKSSFTSCTNKTSEECFCANKAALQSMSASSVPACIGLNLLSLVSTLCTDTNEIKIAGTKSIGTISTETKAAETKSTETKAADANPAFRHAGKPMEPVKRDGGAKHTIYVTEIRTDCTCKTATGSPMHVSQIPVHVPTSSSMVSMVSSTPVGRQHGLLGGVASSSVVGHVGATSSATPSARASGVDAKSFSPYQGAAAGVSVNGGVVMLGAAAVMAVMVAL